MATIAANKKEMDNVLFEVNGFEVVEGGIYLIDDKPDKSALPGMQQMTKYPQRGVSDGVVVRRMDVGPGQFAWDTGFYPDSYCLSHEEDPKKRQKIATQRFNNVLAPYRKAMGQKNAFDHEGEDKNKFFNEVLFHIASGMPLKADDPTQRMVLYLALLSKKVAPENDKGNPDYRETSYIVRDMAKNSKDRDETSSLQFEANVKVGNLIENDKAKLIAVLTYLDFNVVDTTNKDTLVKLIMNYIKISPDRPRTLLKLIADAETPTGLDKFNVYKKLKQVYKKSNKITTSENGKISYNGTEVGADLKGAADNISKNNEFQEIKKELLMVD